MATSNLITSITDAQQTLMGDVWEFSALAKHLSEPDDAPPLFAVLERHARRLEASSERLDVLVSRLGAGGMGGTPMSTQRDQQTYSGDGGVPEPSGANSVGVAPAGGGAPIPSMRT